MSAEGARLLRQVGVWLGLPALLVLLMATAVVVWIASDPDRFLNRVEPTDLPVVSDLARRLHGSAFVVDLHGDPLLFGRDLLERSDAGHIDLPRLQAGGVGLQIFTTPTVAPLGMNVDRTDGEALDLLTLGSWFSWLPFEHMGPLDRALWQAERFSTAAQRSGGSLVPVRDRGELETLLELRAEDPAVVGGLVGVEGAHALEGDLGNLGALYDAGVRMVGIAHFFDNAFAGSAHGLEKGGLTERGRQLVVEMEARGMVVDLAHLSSKAIRDFLRIARRPPIVSHTGVRGTCDNARNLSDEQLRAIGGAGGVIGIGYWETAVCGTSPKHIVAAIRHVIEVVGEDHVSLGSDFDGSITAAFDASGHVYVTQQMLDEGFSQSTVRKVLGGNALRVLRRVLPPVVSAL
ncbi:membrane dipeptidase [Myxococcota bacterium]|nr:membrane dipeptidase [Myxococcota bacterium]